MAESTEYDVKRAEGNTEIRKYPKMMLATVYGHSDNEAFGMLFDYITGNNRSKRKLTMIAPVISSEKIAMTSPVISDKRSFSFVLPPAYYSDTAPEPIDSRVKIEEVPPRTLAVIRFRGYAGTKDLRAKTSGLYAFVEKQSLKAKGEPFLMRYNPPFTPGFLRRNELGIEIVQ